MYRQIKLTTAAERAQVIFRDTRTQEDFDFRFNPSISRNSVYQLGTCQFVRQKCDLHLVDLSGVGKSHLMRELAAEASESGVGLKPSRQKAVRTRSKSSCAVKKTAPPS